MEYKKFCEEVMRQIREYLPEECNVKDISFYETIKNNGVKKTGLTFKSDKGESQPTIYLEEFYQEYQQGTLIEEICEGIVMVYQEAMVGRPAVEMCDFSSFEDVCEKICVRLINYDLNKEFLINGVPHKQIEDLAVYYNIYLHTGEKGIASLVVRNEMLENWGITLDELHDKAMGNTLRILKPELRNITSIISNEKENLLENGNNQVNGNALYVLVSESRNFGAALILFQDLMKQVREFIGYDLYILPASVHETILVSKENTDPIMLGRMVREINSTEVDKEEWLSQHIYELVDTLEGCGIKIVEESREDWNGN